MKKKTFIILIFLFALSKCDLSNECTDQYILQEFCGKLKSGSTSLPSCYYNGVSCIDSYKTCSQYTGTSQTECQAIDLHDNRFKCVYESNQCVQKNRTCSEYSATLGITCDSLTSEAANSRCVLSASGACETHYNDCTAVTDQTKCPNNLPLDPSYKCVYNNGCKNEKKKCSEYPTSGAKCWDLEVTEKSNGKSCILDSSNNCIEDYKYCEDYKASEIVEATCKAIQPYLKDENKIDYSHKCAKQGNECVTVQKECTDETTSAYCNKIIFDNNPNKACVADGSTCKEKYLTCEAYTSSTEAICKAITPTDENGNQDYSIKCVIESNKCVSRKRSCKDDYDSTIIQNLYYNYEKDDYCLHLTPSDNNNRCAYKSSNACQEVPRSCEYYSSSSPISCESIVIYDEKGKRDYSHECETEGNSCQKKLVECEGASSSECNYIHLSDSKKCYYYNSKCIEIPKSCEAYEGNDRILCESIKPYKSGEEIDDDYHCVLEKDSKCTKKKKVCDYSGTSEVLCAKQTPSDPSVQVCVLTSPYNCVERYKYCSEYKGSSSSECIAINPYDPETDKVDPYYKCSYKSSKCVKESKKCSDYSGYDPKECSKLDAEDENKICVLKGASCTAQYKTCDSYKGSSSSDCEGIILSDYTKKCVFTAASGSVSAKCEQKDKVCSDFSTDLNYYKPNYCLNHSLNSFKYQCNYDTYNYNCEYHENDCDEIKFDNESDATEEKCNELNDEDDELYTCTLKMDKTGCRKIYKSVLEEEKKAEEASNPQGGQSGSEKLGGKKYQMILGLLITLLFL